MENHELEAISILKNMKSPSVEFGEIVRKKITNPYLFTKSISTLLNDFKESKIFITSYIYRDLIVWYKSMNRFQKNKITYIDFSSPEQNFIFIMESYLYILNFHCLLFNVQDQNEIETKTMYYIIDNLAVSLERFISIKYFPYLENITLLRCIIAIFNRYQFYNDNLLNVMTKFIFLNAAMSLESKFETIDILATYIEEIDSKERKLNSVRKISNTLREIGNCDQYGTMLVSKLSY